MAATRIEARPPIPNDHVPLAFLLGRRASDYALPSLRHNHRARHTASATQLQDRLYDRGGHVRRREEQAQRLLERVLAKEARTGGALEPPLERGTSADRRHRAEELQRALKEVESDSTNAPEDKATETRREKAGTDLYLERERFSAYHGYVPPVADFVDVVGNKVSVKLVKNLKDVSEEDKRRRTKHHRAKQASIRRMQQVLHEQQVETKAKLRHLVERQKPEASEESSVEATCATKAKAKRRTAKQQRESQEGEIRKIEDEKRREDQTRRESVHRARQEGEAARKARQAALQHEKKTLAMLKSVGPSFQAALRLDGVVNGPEKTDVASRTLSLDTHSMCEEASKREEDSDSSGDLRARLHAHQRELFHHSRSRSLQFGGGFSSKPQRVETEPEAAQTNNLSTEAHGVAPTKSRREVLDAWKSTLLSH